MNVKNTYRIRPAVESDIPYLFVLIRMLAEYERLLDSYTATEEMYLEHGFGEEAIFKALLVENESDEGPEYLGMALYYFTFSTFTGKPTLYLEDIFVLEEYRGRGIGTYGMKLFGERYLKGRVWFSSAAETAAPPSSPLTGIILGEQKLMKSGSLRLRCHDQESVGLTSPGIGVLKWRGYFPVCGMNSDGERSHSYARPFPPSRMDC